MVEIDGEAPKETGDNVKKDISCYFSAEKIHRIKLDSNDEHDDTSDESPDKNGQEELWHLLTDPIKDQRTQNHLNNSASNESSEDGPLAAIILVW